jgi:hypothetical protein
MKLKIRYKGQKLPIVADQIAYAGLFLAGWALKWFKLYLIEYKANGLTTRNNEVRYIFLTWEGFLNRLMQIYGDLKVEAIAEYRLQELTQWGSVMEYTI